jgi:L-threonine kinase
VRTGGTVDTVEFNRCKIAYTRSQKAKVRLAYEMAAVGLRRRDWRLVGAAATISARVNQDILFKPGLEELIDLSRRLGAYGVVVAHSGTVMGMLHDKAEALVAGAVEAAGLGSPETVRMVDGGCRAWVS